MNNEKQFMGDLVFGFGFKRNHAKDFLDAYKEGVFNLEDTALIQEIIKYPLNRTNTYKYDRFDDKFYSKINNLYHRFINNNLDKS